MVNRSIVLRKVDPSLTPISIALYEANDLTFSAPGMSRTIPSRYETRKTSLPNISGSVGKGGKASNLSGLVKASIVLSIWLYPNAAEEITAQVPWPPWQRAPTSTRQGPLGVTMISMCEGPLLISSALSTASLYCTSSNSKSDATEQTSMPKYTLNCPLALRLSYFQMAMTLCTPLRLTESTTYSFPSRNSMTKTPLFVSPQRLIAPLMQSKAALVSARSVHRNTSSDPALWLGFTMTLNGSGCHSRIKSSTSSHSVAKICFAARTPAFRIVSCCSHFDRRASLRSNGLRPSSCSSSMSKSAKITPLSAPGRIQKRSKPLSCLSAETVPGKSEWYTSASASLMLLLNTPSSCLGWL
mmetsp:Transcript_15886/g.28288  ORF Transcript_15886/g.28288 Transcript_15886/m.28288 type:complete len:356 (+) Transcript_15886:98-1165(+)